VRVTDKLISQANMITAKYSRWLEPKDLQHMYDELEALGITVGLLSNGSETCEWYYNGEEVIDSLFVFQVYSDYSVSETKNEYNIYFS
jgi:hypothetical protein